MANMQARYKDRNLPFTAYGSCAVPTSVEDEKTIDARLDAMIAGELAARASVDVEK